MPSRTDCGCGPILRYVGNGRITSLVDSQNPLLDAQWRTVADALGVAAGTRYWLFSWPIAGEQIAANLWTLLLPVGAPPVWKGQGFRSFDRAREAYYDWRCDECGKARPGKPFSPGLIGDREQDD